jgi:NADH:ubiquinone oxidoreductase subunit 5 (subunit L)/multisubunit Na+/H+ antiporter MnhA subunit
MAGFYSKDLIMELFLHGTYNSLIIRLAFIAVGFTSFYTARFSLVIVWGSRTHNPFHATVEDNKATYPIILISAASVTGGASIL